MLIPDGPNVSYRHSYNRGVFLTSAPLASALIRAVEDSEHGNGLMLTTTRPNVAIVLHSSNDRHRRAVATGSSYGRSRIRESRGP